MRVERQPLTQVLAAALLAAACSGGPAGPARARSVVLITLDTTRYDTLSVNGCPAPSTPYLDGLARESLSFDRCRSVAPLTLPAHASMLTGLYPPRHGVRDNATGRLSPAAVTLAERAAEAGITTGAFVSATVLDRRHGLDQGFASYAQPGREHETTGHFTELDGAEVAEAAIRWILERAPSERFLLWVHLFDPHVPYDADPRFVEQVRGHPYVAEVAAADHAVGRILEALQISGQLDGTAVLVVADHGEDLNDHGVPTHGGYCYDSTLHVPMLLRFPDGHGAGERSAAVTSVADAFPTVLDALGLEVPAGADGYSLYGREVPADRGVYFESYYGYVNFGWGPLAGWADAEGKYLHSRTPEFFRTQVDPGEKENLYGSADVDVAPYQHAMTEVAARPALPAVDAPVPSTAVSVEMEKLGYAAGRAPAEFPGPLDAVDRPSPLEQLAARRDYLRATELMALGRLNESVPILERITQENPLNLYALEKLGYAYTERKQWEEAAAILRKRLELAPGLAATHVNLGFALESLGEEQEAAAQYRKALSIDPSHPTARENLERVTGG